MKVAIVETGGWGGIAHYAFNLCNALSECGAEPWLLTNVRYELGELPRAFRVERCFDGRHGYPRAAGRLLRHLAALGPDIVHVQSLLSTRFDGWLWPLVRRRRPLVGTVHNVRSHENVRWEDWTWWRVLRAADAVVVHTQEAAALAARRLGPAARIKVIHHGDYGFFAPGGGVDRARARRRLGLAAGGRLVLAFGAIRPYKGILELIGAWAAVRARHPDASLVIVGPLLVGSEAAYHRAIEGAGVADAVTFRPTYVPHAEVALYFGAADVAVYNYREVTDSGSLRIACSLGTPVVATAVGAFREFLTDGVSARLVPPGDAAALAAALGGVLDDPAGAARMAAAARDLVTARWSWAVSAQATLELYRTVVRERAGDRTG